MGRDQFLRSGCRFNAVKNDLKFIDPYTVKPYLVRSLNFMRILNVFALLTGMVIACGAQQISFSSPGKLTLLRLSIDEFGVPWYSVHFKSKTVLAPSLLGLVMKDGSFTDHLVVLSIDSTIVDETWKPVWGEVSEIRNHYRQLTVHLQTATDVPKRLDLIFRVFDDGIGFRYFIPGQPNLQHFVVTRETTHFALTGNHKAFWIPGDYDTNEYPYTTSALSDINPQVVRQHNEISTRFVVDSSSVQTPLMLKTADGLYINIHEAALVNYPAMQLHIDTKTFTLSSNLVPDAMGNMAYLQTPFATPWRTIIISESAAGILNSKLILNLNEPCKIKETSWIRPQKMIGVWWELHLGKTTWEYADPKDVDSNVNWTTVKPNGRHGATTINTKRYIDFAALHGFESVLVEGWNVGWEDWFGKWKEDVFDFVTPYPDFNVQDVHSYAASKGVKLIMHHETSGSVTNYERRMDEAYRFMKANGYDAVKTGYVGKIIPRGEHHDGQWMINHYNRVAATTAGYEIMVDMHEPTRPTGMHRTYPNWLASEATRGNEFNAWSDGNPPDHETILPFTRLMGGPIDYTPGIFQIKLDKYGKKGFGPHTTLTKQLALCFIVFRQVGSHLQRTE